MRPPPLTSKHQPGPTEYEIKAQRLLEWREKARVRMAMKRAELRSRPADEQAAAAARAREHQAAYRERHCKELRRWEAQRRLNLYEHRFGPEALIAYATHKHERKRKAKEKRRAKEGYYVDDKGNQIDPNSGHIGRLIT
ncbi:hypothetical protein B0H13DRAFT_1872530 [Mycena leptocephala]|nr:hypothetical protein B0H13DRAFT_1872530 [Mycena leptocephala]